MAASLLLGALVGLVMGLTGAGGGILAVPLLLYGLRLPMAQAGPIGLLSLSERREHSQDCYRQCQNAPGNPCRSNNSV